MSCPECPFDLLDGLIFLVNDCTQSWHVLEGMLVCSESTAFLKRHNVCIDPMQIVSYKPNCTISRPAAWQCMHRRILQPDDVESGYCLFGNGITSDKQCIRALWDIFCSYPMLFIRPINFSTLSYRYTATWIDIIHNANGVQSSTPQLELFQTI